MSNITNLTYLNFSHNAITDDAAESIAHFLSQNCKLKLSYNKLQATGAIKILQLNNTKNLIYFDITYNNIGQAARDQVDICFKRLYPTGGRANVIANCTYCKKYINYNSADVHTFT